MPPKMRWSHGTLTLGGDTVVGTVSQGASGHWFAYGCENEWQDVKLGSFESEEVAKRRVEEWVRISLPEEARP